MTHKRKTKEQQTKQYALIGQLALKISDARKEVAVAEVELENIRGSLEKALAALTRANNRLVVLA